MTQRKNGSWILLLVSVLLSLKWISAQEYPCKSYYFTWNNYIKHFNANLPLVQASNLKDSMECSAERECIKGDSKLKDYLIPLLICFRGSTEDCTETSKCKTLSSYRNVSYRNFLCLSAKALQIDTTSDDHIDCEYDSVCPLMQNLPTADQTTKQPLPFTTFTTVKAPTTTVTETTTVKAPTTTVTETTTVKAPTTTVTETTTTVKAPTTTVTETTTVKAPTTTMKSTTSTVKATTTTTTTTTTTLPARKTTAAPTMSQPGLQPTTTTSGSASHDKLKNANSSSSSEQVETNQPAVLFLILMLIVSVTLNVISFLYIQFQRRRIHIPTDGMELNQTEVQSMADVITNTQTEPANGGVESLHLLQTNDSHSVVIDTAQRNSHE